MCPFPRSIICPKGILLLVYLILFDCPLSIFFPIPGGIWDVCECGTEGRNLLMGLWKWVWWLDRSYFPTQIFLWFKIKRQRFPYASYLPSLNKVIKIRPILKLFLLLFSTVEEVGGKQTRFPAEPLDCRDAAPRCNPPTDQHWALNFCNPGGRGR